MANVQIAKTKKKLFNTKQRITNKLEAILGDLSFPIILQYATSTLQYRDKESIKENDDSSLSNVLKQHDETQGTYFWQ